MRSIASFLIIWLFASLLLTAGGCSSYGIGWLGGASLEERAQIAADRPQMKEAMGEHLADKYDLKKEDYRVIRFYPFTEQSFLLGVSGFGTENYTGLWEEYVSVGEERFFVLARNAGNGVCVYDTRQANKYFKEATQWTREKMHIPDNARVDIYVDGGINAAPIPCNPVEWIMYLAGGMEKYPALSGFYDGKDVLSPVTTSLEIIITLPDEMEGKRCITDEELDVLFPADATKGLRVRVKQGTEWGAPSVWSCPEMQSDEQAFPY